MTGGPAIYASQQEYLSAAAKKSKVTKGRQKECNVHRITSVINRLSTEWDERFEVNELSLYSDGIEVKLV